MDFPRIDEDRTCPLPGYEGYTFRVLVNPTAAEKRDWWLGHMGFPDCPDCAAIRENEGAEYCVACAVARARRGRGAVAIYGRSRVAGFDFSTPDLALATFGDEAMPDEFAGWLYQLPDAIWTARGELLKKMVSSPSGTNGVT